MIIIFVPALVARVGVTPVSNEILSKILEWAGPFVMGPCLARVLHTGSREPTT